MIYINKKMERREKYLSDMKIYINLEIKNENCVYEDDRFSVVLPIHW